MTKVLLSLFLVILSANLAGAEGNVSSSLLGMRRQGDDAHLAPAFINAVNRYLRRYEPALVERKDNYVKMRAEYDYLYGIELHVLGNEYEIRVNLEEKTSRRAKAQAQAAKLAAGVQKTMENYLRRSTGGR